MDFKQWTVAEKDMPNDNAKTFDNVMLFVGQMTQQLMREMGESKVVIKRVTVMADGSID